MKIEKLLDNIKFEHISDKSLLNLNVSDISFDSRDIKDNSVFVTKVRLSIHIVSLIASGKQVKLNVWFLRKNFTIYRIFWLKTVKKL